MIHIVDRISSTNTWLSSNSTGSNDCVLALQQIGGKGRGNRVWESPPGGLYLSIISPSHSLLPFIAGISVIQTLELDSGLRLKWPNDIILDGKKVGGILCEDDGKCAVAGIGINLNNDSSFQIQPIWPVLAMTWMNIVFRSLSSWFLRRICKNPIRT